MVVGNTRRSGLARSFRRFSGCVALATLFAPPVFGAPVTWNGTCSNGLWIHDCQNPNDVDSMGNSIDIPITNWVGNIFPTIADDVTIAAGSGTTTVNISTNVNTVTIAPPLLVNKTLRLNSTDPTKTSEVQDLTLGTLNQAFGGGNIATQGTLTLKGTTEVFSGGFLSNIVPSSPPAGRIINQGTLNAYPKQQDLLSGFNTRFDLRANTFENFSTVNINSGVDVDTVDTDFPGDTRIVNRSGAVWNFEGTGRILGNFSNGEAFINEAGATITHSGLEESRVLMPVHNQGTIKVLEGFLDLVATDPNDPSGSPGSEINRFAGGNVEIAAGATLGLGHAPEPEPFDPTIFEFRSSSALWTAGTIGKPAAGTGGTFIIYKGEPGTQASLDIESDGTGNVPTLNGVVLENRNVVNIKGTAGVADTLRLENGADIENQSGGKIILHAGILRNISGSSTFNNRGGGLIEKTGTGEFQFNIPLLTFSSPTVAPQTPLEVKEGTLKLNAGGHFADKVTVRVSPDGVLELGGTYTFGGDFTASGPQGGGVVRLTDTTNISLEAGRKVTFDLSGGAGLLDIQGGTIGTKPATSAELIINGHAHWAGGTFTGRVDTQNGPEGGVKITGSDFKIIDGGTKTIEGLLVNVGTVTQQSDITIGTNGLIINNVNWDIQKGNILKNGSGLKIENNGTFKKTAGTAPGGSPESRVEIDFDNSAQIVVNQGTLKFENGGKHSGGSYQVDAGAMLEFQDGVTEVTGTVTGSGAGIIKLTTGPGLGSYIVRNGGSATFNMTGTTGLVIDGTVKTDGEFINTGVAEWKSGQILGTGDFDNNGTMTVAGNNSHTLDGKITNNGNMTIKSSIAQINTGAKITNTGSMVFDNPASTATQPIQIDTDFYNKGGLVEVKANTFVRIDRDAMSLELAGADANSFLLNPDTPNSRWEVQNGAQLTLDSKLAPNPSIIGLGPNATLVFHGTGMINNLPSKTPIDGNSSFINMGQLFLVDNAQWIFQKSYSQGGSGSKLVIENGSAFRLQSNDLENTRFLAFGGEVRVDGELVVEPPFGIVGLKPLVKFTGRNVRLTGSGTINGKSVDAVGGTVTAEIQFEDGATIAVGNSSGVLTIDADVLLDEQSKIEIEVGGTTPGTEYDQLVINGTATIGGFVAIQELNGFVPTAGQTFDAVVADTFVDNAFGVAQLTGPFVAPSLTTNTGGKQVLRLTAVDPVTYAAVSDTWDATSNWSTTLAPGLTDVAFIPGDAAADTTVIAPASDTTVLSLTIASGAPGAMSTTTLQLNGATLTATRGTTLRPGGRITGIGTLGGSLYNAGGSVGPGNSPGTMTIDGNYIQTTAATFEAEINGTAAGTGYDQLVVTGNVVLAGTLEITVDSTFNPLYGDTFEILTYAVRTGTFDQVTLNGSILALTTSLALAPVYDFPGSADPLFAATPFAAALNTLTLFTTLPGDANLDLQVEDADLSLLLTNFGKTNATWIDGDFTGDGIVDDADLSLLLTNFGGLATIGTGSGFAGNSTSTIPEPATLALLSLGCLLLTRRRAA